MSKEKKDGYNPGPLRYTFAERIRTIRKSRNLQQGELAALLETTGSTICNWEKGLNYPTYLMLQRLCMFFKVDANYFCDVPGVNPETEPEEIELMREIHSLTPVQRNTVRRMVELLKTHDAARDQEKYRELFTRVPMNSLKVCAGNGNYLDDAQEAEYIYLRRGSTVDKADEVITVTGDSMEPTFHDGDLLLVAHQEAVKAGEIGIFLLNGEGMVKEYQPDGLYPHNDDYPVVHPGEEDDLRCCGLVLGTVTEEMLAADMEKEILMQM